MSCCSEKCFKKEEQNFFALFTLFAMEGRTLESNLIHLGVFSVA